MRDWGEGIDILERSNPLVSEGHIHQDHNGNDQSTNSSPSRFVRHSTKRDRFNSLNQSDDCYFQLHIFEGVPQILWSQDHHAPPSLLVWNNSPETLFHFSRFTIAPPVAQNLCQIYPTEDTLLNSGTSLDTMASSQVTTQNFLLFLTSALAF